MKAAVQHAHQNGMAPWGLRGGGGQLPLRAALLYSLHRAWSNRAALYHSLTWGLGIGVYNSLSALPELRPVALTGALLIAAGIGYLGQIPWRWRLCKTRSPWRLLSNGLLALVLGYGLFAGSFLLATFLFAPARLGQPDHVSEIWTMGWGGFIYAVIGLYQALAQDTERRQIRVERQAAQQEARLQEAREMALRSQIQPHFFFNTLNTIAALIPERPEDAERAVELLAQCLRPALTRDQPLTTTLAQEMEVARGYAELEGLRYGDRLTVEFQVPDSLTSCRVPSLCLQPLIENAVRHGVEGSRGKHWIRVRALESEGQLEVVVENGSDQPWGEALDRGELVTLVPGHALANIRERLRSRFGRGADLVVELRGFGTGARALIRIPAGEHAS